MTERKLYRSQRDKMIAGVCGGLGEYLKVDSTLIRLAFAFVLIFTAFVPMLLFYIIWCIVVPRDSRA